MADDESRAVIERGVVTASEEMWALAARRAKVLGRVADAEVVGHEAADRAGEELGLSRRQVYVLLRRWRAGEGVASDVLPGRSSGGRGREHLPAEVEAVMREVLQQRYLSKQRRSVAVVHREVARKCRTRGLRVPSRGTLQRRIAKLDPVTRVAAREGAAATRPLASAGGTSAPVEGLLQQVQIDHTVVDVMIVDERAAPDRAAVCHGGDRCGDLSIFPDSIMPGCGRDCAMQLTAQPQADRTSAAIPREI